MDTDLFGNTVTTVTDRFESFTLPEPTHHNQHDIDSRISSVMMKQFNDSLQTYMQAKRDGRYNKDTDLIGVTTKYDEAKDAMFESLFWAFGLSAFDHVAFETVCRNADDELCGDAEAIRCLLSRVLKDEIQELVWMIRDHKGEDAAKKVIRKLSEYVHCTLEG